jgi:hypothetical protein
VGGEGPTLSKMGGSDWSQAKGKARKAVRDIAVELVKLYSARMSAKGHAFGPDTPWQRELEEAFPFAETPDQLQTIDEIKAKTEALTEQFHTISAKMYEKAQQAQAAQQGAGMGQNPNMGNMGQQPGADQQNAGNDNVVDADFEVVDDEN